MNISNTDVEIFEGLKKEFQENVSKKDLPDAITTHEDAVEACLALQKIRYYYNRFESYRKAEKSFYDDATLRVNNRFREIKEPSKEKILILKEKIAAYMLANNLKHIKLDNERTVYLKKTLAPEIKDVNKALDWIKDVYLADTKDFIKSIAQKELKIGCIIPGTDCFGKYEAV